MELTLSGPSAVPVEAHLLMVGGDAAGHERCGTADFVLLDEVVRFAPGATSAAVTIELTEDVIPEVDETIELSVNEASGFSLGEIQQHELVIVDDDRSSLLDVREDFGAVGDGSTDDTLAIASAIAEAAREDQSVVYFPAGDYRITEIELDSAANYVGRSARLVRAPGQPVDATLLHLRHSGTADSRVVVVQGLVLSGARDEQGAFDDWQFQESSLLSLSGDPAAAGRLRVEVQALRVDDSGGNGVVLGPNVEATVCDLVGEEVFTDFLKLRGGHTELDLVAARGFGTVGTTGVALSGQEPGFGGAASIVARVTDLELETGDLEVDVSGGSSVELERVIMNAPPLYLRAKDSMLRIRDSQLAVGPPAYRFNRVVAPGDTRFENVHFVVSEFADPSLDLAEGDRTWAALGVTWDDVSYAYSEDTEDTFVESTTGQSLVLVDCAFELGPDVEATDEVYVAATETGDDGSHRLVLESAAIEGAFAELFGPLCSGCTTASP